MSAARLAPRLIALTVAALAQPARRAIALAPHAAELVYAAGAGDR
ncbi:cobalamin-binding protein, partial [Bordetella parapertussis]|nr:cobalamin-binding protein [Bordetella parapertussis]